MNKPKKDSRFFWFPVCCLTVILLLAGCTLGDTGHIISRSESSSDTSSEAPDQSVQKAASSDASSDPNIADSRPGRNKASSPETSSGETSSGYEDPKGSDTKSEEEEQLVASARKKLREMTLEEKIAQLFILTPEQLTGMKTVTEAGNTTENALNRRPVGGLIYMKQNLQSVDQTRTMLTNIQAFSKSRAGLPIFTFVDEEGGTVRRISGHFPEIPEIPSMSSLGAAGNIDKVRTTGETMGTYLKDLGFTCDFAPVADVITNESNTVVKDRSFGTDPEKVAEMSLALGQGLESKGVFAVYKHFPGHGATAGDTHEGYASTDRTLDQLRKSELVPFQNAIDHGASFIMAAHISLPNVTKEDVPASLSHEIITNLLREEMGFDGIVVTDSLNMGAIADHYSSGEAAVKAISAGADMLLTPADFSSAYNAVLDAVQSGTLSEERIDTSVQRILKVKLSLRD